MKKLYVTEITFAGKDIVEKSEVLAQHGQTGWTADDIYELLVAMEGALSYIGNPRKIVDASVTDKKALAQWLSSSDLVKYDKAHTIDEETVDFLYNGDGYHLVFLIREVLADFIIDTIEKSVANRSVPLPSGIELY
jgi:hypothetical protein